MIDAGRLMGGRVRLYSDVFGAEGLAGLLDHVRDREGDFSAAQVYSRETQTLARDEASRDCLRLVETGPLRRRFGDLVTALGDEAAESLGLVERGLEPAEVEICSYGTGGHFKVHVDVLPPPARVRVLTCVYYFSALPRPFSGGQIRLHPWPGSPDHSIIEVEPEVDTLLLFPSFLRHEVVPVETRSNAWMDRRFNLTCWLCRPAEPAS